MSKVYRRPFSPFPPLGEESRAEQNKKKKKGGKLKIEQERDARTTQYPKPTSELHRRDQRGTRAKRKTGRIGPISRTFIHFSEVIVYSMGVHGTHTG